MTAEDRVRLAAGWIKRGDPRIICVACGSLRKVDQPPCRCLADRSPTDERMTR